MISAYSSLLIAVVLAIVIGRLGTLIRENMEQDLKHHSAD